MEKNRQKFRDQFPFIINICNGRWLMPDRHLWHLELVQNVGPQGNAFEKE